MSCATIGLCYSMLADYQIRHQAANTMSSQPGDCRWPLAIVLGNFRGYIWFNKLILLLPIKDYYFISNTWDEAKAKQPQEACLQINWSTKRKLNGQPVCFHVRQMYKYLTQRKISSLDLLYSTCTRVE